MNDISKIILPLFVLFVIIFSLKKKISIYDSFLSGATDGLKTCFNIFPAILGMVFAINIFLESDFLVFIFDFIQPFLDRINVPTEIMPMAFLRPISGTATLTIMNDIFLNYGPDSFIGRLSSILQGCTDTTFYVLALYFSSVKINKTRYALKVGLFADCVGILLAIILTNVFF